MLDLLVHHESLKGYLFLFVQLDFKTKNRKCNREDHLKDGSFSGKENDDSSCESIC